MGIQNVRSASRVLGGLSSALLALLSLAMPARADDAAFDLIGPRVEMKVTRGGKPLPISKVPNLQPGDRLWIHPDFPDDQSARYLLVVAFLRGSTNPPPENWFNRGGRVEKASARRGNRRHRAARRAAGVAFPGPGNGRRLQRLTLRRARQAWRVRPRLPGSESSQFGPYAAREISQRCARDFRRRSQGLARAFRFVGANPGHPARSAMLREAAGAASRLPHTECRQLGSR